MPPIITLTTDFGTRQGSHAVMHGVIYNILPEATIVDLSHHIAPQDMRQAGFVLQINAFFFPVNTVHVCVVDPGVGTDRRPIAAQIGPQRFVAPDNGLLTPLFQRAEQENWPVKVVHLDDPRYWLPRVTRTFHGRDVFAPTAAHWAGGVPLEALGSPVDEPVRLPIIAPHPVDGGVEGEIIYIDDFGNAISNILPADIEGLGKVDVTLCGRTVNGMVNTFGDSPYNSGTLISLWDSSGYLMVSENNGTGGKIIQPRPGDRIIVNAG